MNRRHALGTALGTAVGTVVAPTLSAASREPGWKTAIGLNGFMSAGNKYRRTVPIWEVAAFAAKADFDGVALVSGWPQGDYPTPDQKAFSVSPIPSNRDQDRFA